ncbi:MAG: hypothetical protein HKN87_22040 [Saprospiraceae bacterium]|nr:hypothetical protein [Saprospiraceae bacterium]
MNLQVDKYLIDGCMRCPLGATPACKVNDWQQELQELRSLILDVGLTEELKWGAPCYTYDGKNILMLSALKESATVSFFKGSLMKDDHGLLVAPGKNSQAARYLKITDAPQVSEWATIIKAYILEAVEIEKAGLKVPFKKNPEPIPIELENRLNEDPNLNAAFMGLTPGRQRGYIIYFSAPKQAKTREARIEKCIGKILNGEGLHDKYKSGMRRK